VKFWIKKKRLPEAQEVKPSAVELSDSDIWLIVEILHSYFAQISNFNSPDIEILRSRIKDIANRLQNITIKQEAI